MNRHCQTKSVAKKVQPFRTYNRKSFQCMNPNSVTLSLKIATHFLHTTLTYNDVSPYRIWLQKVQRFRRYRTNVNLRCLTLALMLTDTFLPMIIYHQIEFVCKKTYWFRTNKIYNTNRRILII